ncbi:hypothetical protein ABKN59_007217 [Abortiporus biennis]
MLSPIMTGMNSDRRYIGLRKEIQVSPCRRHKFIMPPKRGSRRGAESRGGAARAPAHPAPPTSAVMRKKRVEAVQNAILHGPPFCHGTIDGSKFTLFYGEGGNVRRIDFDEITDAQIEELSNACDPATFGVNQEDVLDESYRKAGKMNSNNFSINFNPYNSEVVDIIRNTLLEGPNADRSIRAELYKLNVYGPGSFFKAHKDTPRGENMFGSLVLILPTTFEGGSLVLRDKGKEWTLDPLHEGNPPADTLKLGYIALYGDVEHEVLEVTSGYRITITYNLYYTTPPKSQSASIILDSNLKAAFEEMLQDPTFLPEGGHVGFGLTREYPVGTDTKMESLIKHLKGSDSALVRVCNELSLSVYARVLYQDDEDEADETVLLSFIPDLEEDDMDGSIPQILVEYYQGIMTQAVNSADVTELSDGEERDDEEERGGEGG